MNELQRQVEIATRRLTIQQFLALLPWTWSASLLVAALAILVRKIWSLPGLPASWDLLWLVGAVVVGLVTAGIQAYLRRSSRLQAALEIDSRFDLKERLSSCLALTPEGEKSQAGQALLADALRRVSKLDVREAFRVRPSRWSWLPACCGLVALGFSLLADAVPEVGATAQASASTVATRVQNASQALKKQLEENRKEAVEQGLPDAQELMNRLERGADSLAGKQPSDQQQALVKLNELAREVQQRQRQLGDIERMKQQFDGLRDIQQGPAERFGKSLASGDLNQAMRELEQLQAEASQERSSKQEQQQLAQQFAEMKEKLQQMAAAQERSRRDLQQQKDQATSQQDRQQAAELQRRLDELASQERSARQAEELSRQLDASAQALNADNRNEAASRLEEMRNSLSRMQSELKEQQLLEKTSSQIAQAKEAMNCKQCEGKGCEECQGQSSSMASRNRSGGQQSQASATAKSKESGSGEGRSSSGSRGTSVAAQGQGGRQGQGGAGQGDGEGQGLGQGRGQGARPESPNDTSFTDSQVPANAGPGQTVVAGQARGANQAGRAIEEIKTEIEANRRSQEDPLTGQRLPKPQRQLTREYFDALREGR